MSKETGYSENLIKKVVREYGKEILEMLHTMKYKSIPYGDVFRFAPNMFSTADYLWRATTEVSTEGNGIDYTQANYDKIADFLEVLLNGSRNRINVAGTKFVSRIHFLVTNKIINFKLNNMLDIYPVKKRASLTKHAKKLGYDFDWYNKDGNYGLTEEQMETIKKMIRPVRKTKLKVKFRGNR